MFCASRRPARRPWIWSYRMAYGPLNVFPGTTVRYQQVYHASQCAAFGSEGALITHIGFRPDLSAPGFAATLPNIQIDLSTTANGPDALSTIFGENVGVDNRTVFSGSMSLSGGPGLWQFIALRIPFLYRPSSGNLLLDVRNFSGVTTVPFDGVSTDGDSVSALFAYPGNNSGDVFSTSGQPATFGLVTLFEYTPVPEPGTISLIAIGLCGIGMVGWWRKAK